MANPPAKCRTCGRIVPARGYEIGPGATDISYVGNTFHPCPHCRGICDVLDGVYDGGESAVTLRYAPQSTIDALVQAGILFQQARAAGKSEDEAIGEAAKALPLLEKLKAAGKHLLVIHMLGAALDLVAQNRINHWLDELFDGKETVTPAVAEAIEKKFYEMEARQRSEAADRAGVKEDAQARSDPGLKLSPELRSLPPRTSDTVDRMQRELVERYRREEQQRARGGKRESTNEQRDHYDRKQ
jgi:hypothetical protein